MHTLPGKQANKPLSRAKYGLIPISSLCRSVIMSMPVEMVFCGQRGAIRPGVRTARGGEKQKQSAPP